MDDDDACGLLVSGGDAWEGLAADEGGELEHSQGVAPSDDEFKGGCEPAPAGDEVSEGICMPCLVLLSMESVGYGCQTGSAQFFQNGSSSANSLTLMGYEGLFFIFRLTNVSLQTTVFFDFCFGQLAFNDK